MPWWIAKGRVLRLLYILFFRLDYCTCGYSKAFLSPGRDVVERRAPKYKLPAYARWLIISAGLICRSCFSERGAG